MRVLVVEDEVRIVEILHEALSRSGFVVDTVRRCAEAREALSLTAYDAAILDLGLPDGDGLTLLADLQSSRNRVPVLVLTARDAVQDRVSGLDAGADDYLVKPFATVEVVARQSLAAASGRCAGCDVAGGQHPFRYDRSRRVRRRHWFTSTASRSGNPGTFDATVGPRGA